MLEKIKAEIQKVLNKERDFTTESAKAQALALNWVLELFDKYAEQEQTGHWVDINGGVECGKCGKWYPHAPIAKNEIKFCCECGARMESEDKE